MPAGALAWQTQDADLQPPDNPARLGAHRAGAEGRLRRGDPIRDKSVILNLPGNPRGAAESLLAVIHLLPHMLDLIAGKTEH